MSEVLTSSPNSTEAPLAATAPAGVVKVHRQVKFGQCEGFMPTMRKRIDAYFEENNLSPRDSPKMYVKTAIILTWVTASYIGLAFYASTWWQGLLGCVSLGFAMAAVGFNIQHDGGHGSYSRFPLVNKLMAFTLDMMGGSSFIWKRTHNVIHHSYTNVTGVDGDIDLGIFGRLSPHQKRYGFHKYQHLYLWFLYGFLTFKWQFHDDASALLRGRVGECKVPRPKPAALAGLLLGKGIFLFLAFGLPVVAGHAWYNVALGFFATQFVLGVLLSIVFQLAHCVEHASFPLPDEESDRLESAWAMHQVETTVDFARDRWLATWFTGGLNYQIEHHLFPQICHVHYPAVAKIVEETSKEFGVHYYAHPTTGGAIASHYRWLREMGRPVSA